uniref:Transglutaminase-like domain-containing protein n=1 Tax=Lotharella globosa TaxID=91324 RepID=A0A7S4DUU6_9EUKA
MYGRRNSDRAYDFILENMSKSDIHEITQDSLQEDVELAKQYRAKSEGVWGPVSDEVWMEYVLPPKVATEAYTPWRKDFHEKYWAKASKYTDAGEAVKFLNEQVFKDLNVSYMKEYPGHKPDQNWMESTKLHHASCTGLSIMLVSACRSVGIPARLAMTPAWVTGSEAEDCKHGLSDEDQNHSWVEVLLADGKWHYIGASEPSEFDQTWFTDQAAKAIPSSSESFKNSIYAVSFKPTEFVMPAPWNREKEISVVEVVERYTQKA